MLKYSCFLYCRCEAQNAYFVSGSHKIVEEGRSMNTMEKINQKLKKPVKPYDIIGELGISNIKLEFAYISGFLFNNILGFYLDKEIHGFLFFDLTKYAYFDTIHDFEIFSLDNYSWHGHGGEKKDWETFHKYKWCATSPLVCCLTGTHIMPDDMPAYIEREFYDGPETIWLGSKTYCSRNFYSLSNYHFSYGNAKIFSCDEANNSVYLEPTFHIMEKSERGDYAIRVPMKWNIQLDEDNAKMISELLHRKFVSEGFNNFTIKICNVRDKVGTADRVITKKFLQKDQVSYRFKPEYKSNVYNSNIIYFSAKW